jgi:hypothetical protein
MKTFLFVLLIVTSLMSSAVEDLEAKFQMILTCNSKSGAAISDVKITTIQDVPSKHQIKVSGTYKQAMPLVATFGKFGTNNFAENSGVFQAFIKDDKVLEAKYKIAFVKGYIKKSCLESTPDGFDF